MKFLFFIFFSCFVSISSFSQFLHSWGTDTAFNKYRFFKKENRLQPFGQNQNFSFFEKSNKLFSESPEKQNDSLPMPCMIPENVPYIPVYKPDSGYKYPMRIIILQ
jgi:hypothetical protein